MGTVDTQYVSISIREYEEYRNLKLGKAYLDVADEIKISALAEKVAAVLSNKGYLISAEQMKEYKQLKKFKGEDYISGVEAARMMGCSPSTITRLAARGKLEMVQVGNVYKYTRRGILSYLDKRKIVPIVGNYHIG